MSTYHCHGKQGEFHYDRALKTHQERLQPGCRVNLHLVDEKEKHYGVYCDYGQDLIPFENAKIIKSK